MTLRVHHYFPLGSVNLGDGLVAVAIRGALERHFGPIEIEPLPVNDRLREGGRLLGLKGENVDRNNASADLVVVGGSNLLEARRHGGWGVETDVDSIERLRPPLLLLGMGTGSSFGKKIPAYEEPARSEVRLLFERAFATAVRDISTERHLARIGVTTRTTGCPVTFLTDAPITAGPEDAPLLVSFPPPRIARKLSGRAFMRGTRAYLHWLQERGVPTVVTLHDTRDVDAARELVPSGMEIFLPKELGELRQRFEVCRGVIGFRLHAGLLGLGLGKPAIAVGIDWRSLGFIETFDLHDISCRSRRPGQFRKLRRLTRLLLDGDESLIRVLDGAKSEGRAREDAFLSDAAARFRDLASAPAG